MPVPTLEELTTEFAQYINTPAANNRFVAGSVEKAIEYIEPKVTTPTTTAEVVDGYVTPGARALIMPEASYREEICALAADLFYRRQAQNGVVSVNALEGTAIRLAKDPYAACDLRLQRWIGFGIA